MPIQTRLGNHDANLPVSVCFCHWHLSGGRLPSLLGGSASLDG
jgi:hypothetical protein